MKVTWMAGLLAAAGGLALPAPSEAGTQIGIGITVGSDHHRDHRRGRRDYVDTFRMGYGRGYEDGIESGRRDVRRHDRFDFRHDKRYRKGDHGYKRQFGPRQEYCDGYRSGFEEGYRRAFAVVRHRHHGRGDWCYEDHGGRHRGGRYGDDRVIYEEPRRRW